MSGSLVFLDRYNELSQTEMLGFPLERLPLLERYYQLVLSGNRVQNLTRILDVNDFWDSNVLDVLKLSSMNLPDGTPIDIGSGVGVPGLLLEVMTGQPGLLVESEKLKAEFLQSTISELSLNSKVSNVRAEKLFRGFKEDAFLISRATASITKIWDWTHKCSTWNTVFLFKSRKWPEEWSEFESLKPNQLRLVHKIDYESGADKKFRTIVRLERIVPRGTIK